LGLDLDFVFFWIFGFFLGLDLGFFRIFGFGFGFWVSHPNPSKNPIFFGFEPLSIGDNFTDEEIIQFVKSTYLEEKEENEENEGKKEKNDEKITILPST
jgi:hypothetical protein